MSGVVWKHEAPRLCRIRRALFGASPSAILGRCTLGLRHGCRACKGCEHNVAEIMLEGFEEGTRRAQEIHEPVEEAEPPEPTTMTPEQRTEALTEAFKNVVMVYTEAARALHEWAANVVQALAPAAEHIREIIREALENAAKKPPRVNKRPDYSQKAKDDTRGKTKRIRTQRSREKK